MVESMDPEIFGDAGSDEEESDQDDTDSKFSPWKKSFDELKSMMVEVPNEFAKIFKKIVREGEEEPIGDRNCRIQWTYSMFLEGEEQSFDFMWKPSAIDLSVIGLLGTQLAVQSMRTKEEAQFILPYKLMFRELGCPPRIKPKADILLVVKLFGFTDIGDEAAYKDVPEEDRHKFYVLKDKIYEMYKSAKDYFKYQRYKYAASVSQDAIRTLEFCQVADETEQKEQEKLLVELYAHLSDCYVKMGDWKKVCLTVNELRRRHHADRSVRILMNEGIALSYVDDEFQRSIRTLRKAQKLDPHNKAVNQALDEVLKKDEKYKKEKSAMWQKAFELKEKLNNSTN